MKDNTSDEHAGGEIRRTYRDGKYADLCHTFPLPDRLSGTFRMVPLKITGMSMRTSRIVHAKGYKETNVFRSAGYALSFTAQVSGRMAGHCARRTQLFRYVRI